MRAEDAFIVRASLSSASKVSLSENPVFKDLSGSTGDFHYQTRMMRNIPVRIEYQDTAGTRDQAYRRRGLFHQYRHHPGRIIVGMSEEKKFCPKCKAMTMEPAEGTVITPEELNQMESAPLVFEGKLTPYQCPICLHFAYQPEF
jgi:hypothetical protein